MNSRDKLGMLNKLLATATLVLVSAALYCAQGLRHEQSRLPPDVTVIPTSVQPPAAPEGDAAAAPASVGVDTVDLSMQKSRDAADLAIARYRLARLADPQGRTEQVAESTGIRRDWQDLAAFAGLTPEDINLLVEHADEARMQKLQQLYACQADPACEPPVYSAYDDEVPDEQLVRIVGSEKAGSIRTHRAASAEHLFVRMLRDLPAGRNLGDADAGQLALVLAEERQRFEQDAAQSGAAKEAVDGPFVGYYLRIAVAPGVSDTRQKLESAAQYNTRLHERASAILDDGLLARFKAIQDAAMDAYRRSLREREVAQAARQAASLP